MQTPTHTVTVQASLYGLPGRWAKVQVLPSSNRGRNARGTSGSLRGWGSGNPRHARRAKRQGVERMGNVPVLRQSNWHNV